jgi:dolichol-phosphate mannosyltransferase
MFLRGLVRWLGFPITTVPFTRGTRRNGSTKYSVRRMVELAITGIAAHCRCASRSGSRSASRCWGCCS